MTAFRAPAASAAALVVFLLAACGESAHLREAQSPAATAPAADSPAPPARPGTPPAPEGRPPPGGSAADDRLGPPYPIVLVHGFMAARKVGPVDYWWGIPEALRENGETVFVADDEPMRTPQSRALELAAFVDDVLARTRARKVNLVAHSMGGLDSRVLIHDLGYGDRVASLTTIATPHRGSQVADGVLGLIPAAARDDVERVVDALAEFLDGDPQEVLKAAAQLTTGSAAEFNRTHPDDPRVAYFSFVGRTTDDPLFLVRGVDFCDVGLLPTFEFLKWQGIESDGLVPVESQRWGEVVAEIQADHYNEVGQPLGVVGFAFDPWRTYVGHAKRLHERGF